MGETGGIAAALRAEVLPDPVFFLWSITRNAGEPLIIDVAGLPANISKQVLWTQSSSADSAVWSPADLV